MPVHDWTRVEAGIFHDFHGAWIIELRNALNSGLLPKDYYALSEQHAGRYVPDLITLHARPAAALPPLPPATGGLAVADAPPQVRLRTSMAASPRMRRRTLAVRDVSGHRLVAMLEIVSSNKDRAEHVEELAAKIVTALEAGIHVLLVDLWPPGECDPVGMHGAVREWFGDLEEPYDLPPGEPFTLASYNASPPAEVFVEHLAVGRRLPEMPLFFHADRYINVPVEATYQAAFAGTPAFWREVLCKDAG